MTGRPQRAIAATKEEKKDIYPQIRLRPEATPRHVNADKRRLGKDGKNRGKTSGVRIQKRELRGNRAEAQRENITTKTQRHQGTRRIFLSVLRLFAANPD